MGLRITFDIPASAAKDLAERQVFSAINGNAEVKEVLPANALEYSALYQRGDQVTIYGRDLDTSGNLSAAGPAFSFTAVDDIPPGPPGAFSIKSKVEED